MKTPVKYAIVAAVILLMITAAVRTCDSRHVPHNDANMPEKRVVKASSARGESSGGFFGFFEEIFRSDSPGTTADEEPDFVQVQPNMASELNIISEKLEEMEKLPESVWYPNSTDKDEVNNHTIVLRELVLLGSMVRAGTATPEQNFRYIEIKMKLLQEKIEMIRISQDKAGDVGDRESGDSMTLRLEKEVSELRNALGKL